MSDTTGAIFRLRLGRNEEAEAVAIFSRPRNDHLREELLSISIDDLPARRDFVRSVIALANKKKAKLEGKGKQKQSEKGKGGSAVDTGSRSRKGEAKSKVKVKTKVLGGIQWMCDLLGRFGIAISPAEIQMAASNKLEADNIIEKKMWTVLNDLVLLALAGFPANVGAGVLHGIRKDVDAKIANSAPNMPHAFVKHYFGIWGYSVPEFYSGNVAPSHLLLAFTWLIAQSGIIDIDFERMLAKEGYDPLPPHPMPNDTSYRYIGSVNGVDDVKSNVKGKGTDTDRLVHRLYELMGQIHTTINGISCSQESRVRLAHRMRERVLKLEPKSVIPRELAELHMARLQFTKARVKLSEIVVLYEQYEENESIFWNWVMNVCGGGGGRSRGSGATASTTDTFATVSVIPNNLQTRLSSASSTLSRGLVDRHDAFEQSKRQWNRVKEEMSSVEYDKLKAKLAKEAHRIDASLPSLSTLYSEASALPQTKPFDFEWSEDISSRFLDQGIQAQGSFGGYVGVAPVLLKDRKYDDDIDEIKQKTRTVEGLSSVYDTRMGSKSKSKVKTKGVSVSVNQKPMAMVAPIDVESVPANLESENLGHILDALDQRVRSIQEEIAVAMDAIISPGLEDRGLEIIGL